MAKLRLAKIELMPVARQTVETLAEAEETSLIPVVLSLVNTGRSKELYFVSKPRCIQYEPDTRQLFLGFEGPDPAMLVRPELRKPPSVDSLAPGCETKLVARVPLVLKMIRTKARVDQSVTELDLSGMVSVHCRVAYSEKKFYRRQDETAIEMVNRFHHWGERVDLTEKVSVQIPTETGEYPFQKAK